MMEVIRIQNWAHIYNKPWILLAPQQMPKMLLKILNARGGREQLLMFLTGPAGSVKITSMKVAQQFCYEFCITLGIMWSDKTFIFTAYTGLSASLFDGVTISKAAFLNQRKQLSVGDRNEW
jgi:hypothetical protein